MTGLFELKSNDAAHVAVASVVLAGVESAVFSTVYPLLPPIVIVPFVTCFFFGVTLAFSGKQFAIGIVALIITALVKGAAMPGQFMIPVYGLLFQGARADKRHSCRIAGFAGSSLHVVQGTVLAPLIFSVAPATALVAWVKPYTGTLALAVVVCALTLGVCGMLAADAGCRTGLRVRKDVAR